jgi:hypothetical protein
MEARRAAAMPDGQDFPREISGMLRSRILKQAALAGFRREPCDRADHRLHGRQSGAEYDDRNLQ